MYTHLHLAAAASQQPTDKADPGSNGNALRCETSVSPRRRPDPMARGLVAALSLPGARLGAGATPCSGRPVVVRAAAGGGRAHRRGLMVVRAGGPPSANVLFLAFVLPLSLFVGTLVTAARVADDLDERFLREMEINQAIMEENEASDEDIAGEDDGDEREEEEEAQVVEEKEPVVAGAAAAAAAPRTRNRPRRQVQ